MARLRFFPLLLLSLILLVSTAGAIEEIKQENIYSFDIEAPEGLVLSGMTAEDLTPDANSTFVLNAYGDEYTLYVNSSRTYHANWKFDITVVAPNGSSESTQLSTIQPFATNYDIHLQYYALEWDTVFDIDIYTGILPLSASFEAQSSAGAEYASLLPDEYTYNTIAFSEISGSSTQPMTVTLYALNEEEFEDQSNGDIWTPITDAVGDIFSWTWDAVLSFVGLIPYVGDDFVTAIIIASYIINEVFFYFNLLLIEYIETTILTLEFFIFSYAVIKNKRRQPVNIAKAVAEYHISAWSFIIGISLMAINLVLSIILAIANIVQSMKPT